MSGTTHINYTVDLVVWYYDNCAKKKIEFKSYNQASPATQTKQPITINAEVPSSGPFWVEATIVGQQCSGCANGWGGTSNDAVDHCIAQPVSGGNRAAYPRWNAYIGVQTPGSALTIDRWNRMRNVPNSCGCAVPN